MRRLSATALICFLVLIVLPNVGTAQSGLQGLNLANQAEKMANKARSAEDLEKAVRIYEQALRIFERVGDKKRVAWVFNRLGRVYMRVGRYNKAVGYYEQALAIARKLGYRRTEAISLNNFGVIYWHWGQFGEAVDYYKQALVIQRKLKDKLEEAVVLTNIGSAYRDWGQLNKALDYCEQALAIARKLGSTRTQVEAVVSNNLVGVYMLWGQYGKAMDYSMKSLAIKRKLGDRKGEAISLGTLGNVYDRLGQYNKAVDCYKQGLAVSRKSGNRRTEATILLRLGTLYSRRGDYDTALSMLQQGLNAYSEMGIPTHGPKNLIAMLYLDQGNIARAESLVRDVGSYSARGRLHLLKSEYEQAKDSYEKLLKSAEKSRNAGNLFTAYTGLGKVYEAQEEYEKALQYFSKGMKLTEEIRSSLQPAQRKNFFDVKIGGFYRSEPAKGLTRVRLKLNQSAKSIDSSEVTRARAFSDGISQRPEQGYTGLPKKILEKEDQLVSKIVALKQSRNKTPRDKNPERYDNITKEIKGAEKELSAFIEMLWNKHKAYAAVKYPRPVKLKDSAVQSEEHLVVFDVVGEGVGVKLIKGKSILTTFYVKWDLKDLEAAVKKFLEPFEKMQLKDFDHELGKNLYKKLLLRALVDVPEGTPLVIIPDGVLAALPFEALVMGGKATWKEGSHGDYPDGLQFVGDVYPISYYQSITALTLARTLGKKTTSGKRFLVMADPVFSSDDDRVKTMTAKKKHQLLASLPSKLMSIKSEIGLAFPRLTLTGDLGNSLKKLYSGEVDLYTGMKAKKDLLFKKPLNGYGGIVFATHGYFGTDLPGIQEPVLALTLLDHPKGKDGFLRMTEVMGLKLNADVVALTACQTGLGRRLSGEGTMNMGRSFQYAGARSVLMSLWSVAESSSVKLVESFFRHLKEGKSKLEALRLARKEIREAGYNHPFYWAPFILVGEGD